MRAFRFGAAGVLLCLGLLPAAAFAQDVCGDASVTGIEECDDGNTASGDCCSASCQFEPAGSLCPDDGSVCSSDLCDGAGVCVHAAANAGTLCREQVAQSGLGAVPAGALGFPAAISKDWFDTHACGSSEPIVIFPSSGSSCANLHTFTNVPATAFQFGKVVDGLTNGTFTTPPATAGATTFEFVGGSIESKCSNLQDLFQAKQQGGVWSFLIPVHDRECSSNVTQSVLIAGFATARITQVLCGSQRRLELFVDCDLLPVGQGGGPDFGTLVEGFGPCDAPEYCDGVSPVCPADGKSTAVCRPSSGVCDLTETCDGISGMCPADAKSTASCRLSAGGCDVAEVCDGILDSCPSDAFLPVSSVCRPSGGVCDLEETCTGGAAACPADQKSTTTCRPSSGVCDPAETCDGSADSCPADAKAVAVCRPSGGVCDLAESCDGVASACPSDLRKTSVCRPSSGVCDPAESCDGTSQSCPADAKSTAACRAAVGVCDVAEVCDGVSNSCPDDAFVSASSVCRTSNGICDPAETCTGSGALCPADQKSTATCRPSAGVCDLAEACDGSADSCPADAKAVGVCRPSGGVCDLAESCNGTSSSCPANSFATSVTTCRDSAGVCDLAETCTGFGAACPADGELACDDGDPCTQDSCDLLAEECRHLSVPATTCRRAGRSGLTIKLGSRGKVKWKWNRGEATSCDDVGAPSLDTEFDLCVYDGDGGGTYTTASHYRLPTGVLWSVRGDCDWTYFDKGAGVDGVRKVRIKARDFGRSSILFDARAPEAPLPIPVAPDRLMTMDPGVLVQLHNSQGICWESEFVEARKNTAERFGAKGRETLEP